MCQRKRHIATIAFPSWDGAMWPGFDTHHRLSPSYALTCPIIAVQEVNRAHGAHRNRVLIFQVSDVVMFSGRAEAMVVHARVLGVGTKSHARV